MTDTHGTQERGFSLRGTDEASDLSTLLSRARSVDADAAVRLQGFGRALAAWVPVIHPAGLLDRSPVVLGLRGVSLADPTDLDVTVSAASVLDRLARAGTRGPIRLDRPVWLSAPPQEVTAPWAGIVAPRSGWSASGVVSAQRVREAARDGVQRVAAAVPVDSGAAAVSRVRAEVWGASSGWGPLDVPDIPDGAAFGLDVLGFLPSGEMEVRVATEESGQWLRVSTGVGHVLVKVGAR